MGGRQYDAKAVRREQGIPLLHEKERSQKHHSSEEASNDRGAKDGKERGYEVTTKQEGTAQSAEANQSGETRQWVSPAVWTPSMTEALLQGRVRLGKWHSLIDKVWKRANLLEASEKVIDRYGSAGVDHVTCDQFESNIEAELDKIEQSLRNGTYTPQRIRRVEIPKPGSREKRPLGIPTVRDRVVQGALKNVIEPIFEHEFLECSYGFRPERGQKDALREVEHLLKMGYCHVVDVDIKRFFDTIDHEILMEEVEGKIADGRILELIKSFLKAEILSEEIKVPDEGTPQGGIISPLLANIYLHPLDKKLTAAGYRVVRFADDLVIPCRTQEEATQAKEYLTEVLNTLKLEINCEKTKVVNFNEPQSSVEFLGYRFYRNRQGKIRRLVSSKSKKKFRDKVRTLTRRVSGAAFKEIVKRLNQYLGGWISYFKHCSRVAIKDEDEFIRRRLRTILRKRSKRKGQSKGLDHFVWTNQHLETLGYQSLTSTHAALRSASR